MIQKLTYTLFLVFALHSTNSIANSPKETEANQGAVFEFSARINNIRAHRISSSDIPNLAGKELSGKIIFTGAKTLPSSTGIGFAWMNLAKTIFEKPLNTQFSVPDMQYNTEEETLVLSHGTKHCNKSNPSLMYICKSNGTFLSGYEPEQFAIYIQDFRSDKPVDFNSITNHLNSNSGEFRKRALVIYRSISIPEATVRIVMDLESLERVGSTE